MRAGEGAPQQSRTCGEAPSPVAHLTMRADLSAQAAGLSHMAMSMRPRYRTRSQRVVPANAGTHNPWPQKLKKASAAGLKRESAPYGSLRSQGRLVEGLRKTLKLHVRAAQKIPYEIALPQTGRGKAAGAVRKHNLTISRRVAPEFCSNMWPSSIRGRREDRVRAAPAVSRAKVETKTHTSIQVQRKQSGLPCAMVLTVSFVLSPVPAFLPPSPRESDPARLDASIGAPEPHDFAVRLSAVRQ